MENKLLELTALGDKTNFYILAEYVETFRQTKSVQTYVLSSISTVTESKTHRRFKAGTYSELPDTCNNFLNCQHSWCHIQAFISDDLTCPGLLCSTYVVQNLGANIGKIELTRKNTSYKGALPSVLHINVTVLAMQESFNKKSKTAIYCLSSNESTSKLAAWTER